MYDVVVVGAGPGGYVSAIRAAQLGMKVALVEQEELGGVCLNVGCIPTKSLLRTAEIKHLIDRSSEFGFELGPVHIRFEKITERAKGVTQTLIKGIRYLLKKNKIDVIFGRARLGGPKSVDVGEKNLQSHHIILATGARPRRLPGIDVHERIWSSTEALFPSFIPKSLIIIGSGAIGIEFASYYSTLGCKVTVIEMMDRILPSEDHEISAFALSAFKDITFHLSSKVEGITASFDKASVKISGETLCADAVLVAIGVVGNTENLGLEEFGIQVESGHIKIDKWGQTSCSSVFAIGDVAGPPWLAHKASHEGIICVEHMAGLNVHSLDKTLIPGCTYSLPQIASVGSTEAALLEKNIPFRVGKFSFKGNGKALAVGEPDGLVKTLFHADTGELLGAHMIGEGVTEMIQGFVIAKSHEATDESLTQVIFAHPTLSEMMGEAVLDSLGRVLHG